MHAEWNKLLGLLQNAPEQVVLRRQDILANLQKGGDVDVLVGRASDFKKALCNQMGKSAWEIHRSYVEQEFYDWGHLDIARNVEWRGAVYLSTTSIIGRAAPDLDGIKRPLLAHEATISWFSSLLWGGFFKTRYREIILEAARTDASEFKRVLQGAAGVSWGTRLFQLAVEGRPEASEAWARSLRRTVWWRAFCRRPFSTTAGFFHFVMRELALNLAPPTPWIAVMGPDGCGKSTVINLLRERLKLSGIKTSVFHWRPQVLRPGDPSAGPVTNPHGKPPRGLLASMAKLGFLLADWQVGYRFRMARMRAKAQVVLFDRHYFDLLIDPRRYRYGGPAWLARLIGGLIPKPDLLFLLDAPTPVLQARKQEVSAEETERQRQAYRTMVQGLKYGRILDATQPPEQVAEAMVAEIFRAARPSGAVTPQ